jgi:hypothetical protein
VLSHQVLVLSQSYQQVILGNPLPRSVEDWCGIQTLGLYLEAIRTGVAFVAFDLAMGAARARVLRLDQACTWWRRCHNDGKTAEKKIVKLKSSSAKEAVANSVGADQQNRSAFSMSVNRDSNTPKPGERPPPKKFRKICVRNWSSAIFHRNPSRPRWVSYMARYL